MEMFCVPVIATIVYGIIELLKIPFNSEKFKSFAPLISGLLGGALGILAMIFSPSIIPVTNYFSAFLIGMASGLSATGTHQTFKQISSYIDLAKSAVSKPDNKDSSNKNDSDSTKKTK